MPMDGGTLPACRQPSSARSIRIGLSDAPIFGDPLSPSVDGNNHPISTNSLFGDME
jgi:hypothetical protein